MNNETAVEIGNELTAALATIEKCREIVGCPDGIDLQDHLRQLAAENVALKALIPENWQMHDVLHQLIVARPGGVYFNKWEKLIAGVLNETPATDRIYAGIKADGVEWTEGAEPSEFGRYWVRYETYVGPQYCSAQWMEYNFCASSTTNIHKIWLADHSRSINILKGVTHYTKLPAALEGGAL